MGSLWLDIRYALRMMVKTPGLTAVLAITLALGIGASTTIFSVVNSVVLRPLPYEQPDLLVRVYTEFLGKMQLKSFWLSPPEFDDLQKGCRSCAFVGGWARGSASLSGGDRPVRIQAAYATSQLLPLLGVKPLLGRTFDASEDRPGDPTVVVLGYDVWQRAFGGARDVVGRQIHLDAMPVTVIGVMPKGFDFLDGEEAWVPADFDYAKANRGGHFVNTLVRLKPGVSLAQFQAALAALANSWGQLKAPKRHAIFPGQHPMVAVPFQADLVGSLATTLWLLQGAVLFVLLISIVNVANLLIARADTRSREIAVRHARGANRRRLKRQFITESVILGLLGGALGVLVAVWAVDGVTALIPKAAPRASEITLDGTAVVFAVVCSIVAALLFGIAPIVHARKTDLHGALKDGSPRMTGSKARLRLRRALVITEIALAVVLVVGCTVMIRNINRLQHVAELGRAAVERRLLPVDERRWLRGDGREDRPRSRHRGAGCRGRALCGRDQRGVREEVLRARGSDRQAAAGDVLPGSEQGRAQHDCRRRPRREERGRRQERRHRALGAAGAGSGAQRPADVGQHPVRHGAHDRRSRRADARGISRRRRDRSAASVVPGPHDGCPDVGRRRAPTLTH